MQKHKRESMGFAIQPKPVPFGSIFKTFSYLDSNSQRKPAEKGAISVRTWVDNIGHSSFRAFGIVYRYS